MSRSCSVTGRHPAEARSSLTSRTISSTTDSSASDREGCAATVVEAGDGATVRVGVAEGRGVRVCREAGLRRSGVAEALGLAAVGLGLAVSGRASDATGSSASRSPAASEALSLPPLFPYCAPTPTRAPAATVATAAASGQDRAEGARRARCRFLWELMRGVPPDDGNCTGHVRTWCAGHCDPRRPRRRTRRSGADLQEHIRLRSGKAPVLPAFSVPGVGTVTRGPRWVSAPISARFARMKG